MRRNLKTVTAVAADGPFSEGQLRWFVFREHDNGLAKLGAVVRVGRRVYLDIDKFEAWITKQNQKRTAEAV